jgi:hypothetical protein
MKLGDEIAEIVCAFATIVRIERKAKLLFVHSNGGRNSSKLGHIIIFSHRPVEHLIPQKGIDIAHGRTWIPSIFHINIG